MSKEQSATLGEVRSIDLVGLCQRRLGDSLEVLDAIRVALKDGPKETILDLVNGYIDRARDDLRLLSAPESVADAGLASGLAAWLEEMRAAEWTQDEEAEEDVRTLDDYIRRLRQSIPSETPLLTDDEIAAAWNSAKEDRPEAGRPDLYLHYMRAVAEAQRKKTSALSATPFKEIGVLHRPRTGEVHFMQEAFSIPLALHGTLKVYMKEGE